MHATVEPLVALRIRDGMLIGRSSSDVFTQEAAMEIASLAGTRQRAWGRELALLLSMAAHDREELSRAASRHAVAGYQHREFTFEPGDSSDDLDPTASARLPKRTAKRLDDDKSQDGQTAPLADPMRFGLAGTTAGVAGGPVDPGLPRGLKPPTSDEPDPVEPDGPKPPPDAKPRFANTEVEGAASPFVAEYELTKRGCTVVRQGPNVGADYFASDGRYIEVKAFSGTAPDSFELEATEWRAAQHPEIAERYWVYVVEHLRDGLPPKITAVFNPVLDDAPIKEPTGKLRVRGWKSAKTQDIGQFAERTATD
jgi:hypothetical protein